MANIGSWWQALLPICILPLVFSLRLVHTRPHCFRPWWILFALLCNARIGEASNPGPAAQFEQVSFTLGTFNPSGLRNKSQYFSSQLPNGDVWAISETHFYGKDVSKFRASLRASNLDYKYCVTDQTSLKPCLMSQNAWKGVATIAKHPTRAVPSSLPRYVEDSGRALITSTLIDDSWVNGATVYGEPDGHLYPNHVRNNECLLHHAAAHICHLANGLRYVAGDWNVAQDSLPAFSMLEQAGFRDLQDVALARWGKPIEFTCKMATRKDFFYISPELQDLLCDVHVIHDVWPDHSVLYGTFQMPSSAPDRWIWPQPQPLPWPAQAFAVQWNPHVDPTIAYQQLWIDLETQAGDFCPFPVSRLAKGRAQRLEPLRVRPNQFCPLKKGRYGDFQPEFCGTSVRHAQWVRQVRRFSSIRMTSPEFPRRWHPGR